MKAFYTELIRKFKDSDIKNKFTSNNLPSVKFVDLYAGQDYNEKGFEAHLFPAVFVKWSIDYKSKMPIATITFRLAYEQLRDTSSISRASEKSLQFLDFITVVDDVIKSIETPNTGKITLLSEDFNIEDTIVDVYTLVYNCTYSGKKNTLKTAFKQGVIDDVNLSGNLHTKLLID